MFVSFISIGILGSFSHIDDQDVNRNGTIGFNDFLNFAIVILQNRVCWAMEVYSRVARCFQTL